MRASEAKDQHQFSAGARAGWEAALLEIEHQAEHWDTLDHGQTGYLLARALRAAVDVAREGGLRCEHRGGAAAALEHVLRVVQASEAAPPPPAAGSAAQPPSAAA